MTATPHRAMLKAHALTCIRNDRTLFSDLSFGLDPGQAVLVEGRNGSGKTSLLRILCGIRLPDQGRVEWNGRDIARYDSEFRAATAWVGHQDGIKLELTAQENLEVARGLGAPSAIDPAQALTALDLAGFDLLAARKLSAGQRRRLALARLLITRARLWILDEPFTSLDRHSIERVENLLKEHLANGGMLAVTSHHPIDLDAAGTRRIKLSA